MNQLAKNTNSSMGFLTSIWGPPFWFVLHLTSFNYPVNPTRMDKELYKSFLHTFAKVLPCRFCRENFEKNKLAAGYNERIFDSRRQYSRFIFDLHNEVNRALGKRVLTDFASVQNMYELFRARCVIPEFTPQPSETEQGCVNPLFGVPKAKCILRFVPRKSRKKCFVIAQSCKPKR